MEHFVKLLKYMLQFYYFYFLNHSRKGLTLTYVLMCDTIFFIEDKVLIRIEIKKEES